MATEKSPAAVAVLVLTTASAFAQPYSQPPVADPFTVGQVLLGSPYTIGIGWALVNQDPPTSSKIGQPLMDSPYTVGIGIALFSKPGSKD
jgi:hypothetical protein